MYIRLCSVFLNNVCVKVVNHCSTWLIYYVIHFYRLIIHTLFTLTSSYSGSMRNPRHWVGCQYYIGYLLQRKVIVDENICACFLFNHCVIASFQWNIMSSVQYVELTLSKDLGKLYYVIFILTSLFCWTLQISLFAVFQL